MPLEEHLLVSTSGLYTRKIWHLRPQRPAQRLGIFLDGEFYVERMDAPAILADLQDRALIPPMACLFVSHLNAEARHHDFICDEPYARFIAEEAISWLRARHEGMPAGGHLLSGTSLSGLQAAYTSLHFPQTFGAALCQSGSFWWNKEWLRENLPPAPTPKSRYWVSVGDKEINFRTSHPPTGLRQEIDQITASRNFADSLATLGFPTHYHLREGSHDANAWKEELPSALQWLLGKE